MIGALPILYLLNIILPPLLHSSSKGAPGNRAFYDNPKVDKLLEDARRTPSEKQRLKDYAEVQKIAEKEFDRKESYKTIERVIAKLLSKEN